MWQVKNLRDREEILSFLQQDRLYAAYAIGDLEPSLFARCQWFGAEDNGKTQALALLFTGLNPHALFTMGDTDGVAAILDSALRLGSGQALQPKRAYFTCRAEHLPVVEASYALDEIEKMLRMVITSADFRPVLSPPVLSVAEGPKGHVPGPAIRLNPTHLDQLLELYRLGGGSAFAPYQLRDGVYYGIEVSGQLVSVAGTHLVSPTFGVAAVGNIFTRPNHRRRGYATACTSHVVEELLALRRDFGEPFGYAQDRLSRAAQDRAQGLDVVLNVNRENAEAIEIYERLGFRRYCPFIEVVGERK